MFSALKPKTHKTAFKNLVLNSQRTLDFLKKTYWLMPLRKIIAKYLIIINVISGRISDYFKIPNRWNVETHL
jgi:hypothetical protein